MKTKLRRLLSSLAAAAFVAALPLTVSADAVILHTNDIHCGIAKNIHIAAVAQYKHDLQQENPGVILVDAGDTL